ncbi:C4b-binding protein-like isoform X2 [Stegostoma tigrinum]|uniref:C4b-binding protein-like isoform X2 n=1 Tax=Stegostoma tigrinum TaxID=3053191 RepID=UPI00202B7219|nr:C4b-binding protein-like isoform X2 [Stegostoma tigrinum]
MLRRGCEMLERLILAVMAFGVARVTGECSKPPHLENGFPTNEFTSETLFDVGTKITYKCNLGYVFKKAMLNGSRSVTCKEDSTWTPLEVICEPKTCGNPGTIANGYYEATSATFGSKVTFHCDRGYKMVGRSFRVCKADGWDGQIPACEAITCDDLPPISNGKTPTPPYGDHWKYGMVAAYSCNNGISLIGADKLICTATGKWDNDPPTCKIVECQRPELPANGNIKEGLGPIYKYQETISYICNEGFEMVGKHVIECKDNNTFVPAPPICKPRNCGNPGNILNGYYEIHNTSSEMKATFYCNKGYQMVGRNYSLCKADGWDGQVPTCKEIKIPLPRKIGETKENPPVTYGTTGIVISCTIGVCVGIGGAAGLYFYNKKRQRTLCKKVHINPQPSENQVETNVNEYHDHPA